MTLGAMLRHARVARGLACDDIARATRIPVRMIVAIENDDWAALPGGIYTRAYMRAYAREVGMDGEPLVARYRAEHAPVQQPVTHASPRRDGGWSVRVPRPRRPFTLPAWNSLASPALAAVLIALYVFVGRVPAGGTSGNDVAAVADTAGAAPESSIGRQTETPVGTTASAVDVNRPADVVRPSPAADAPLVLDLAVTRTCWLTVTVDGSRRTYRLVRPGERERHEGREFVVRAGDAGALQVSIDGEAPSPIGRSGQVVTVRFTRANVRSVLRLTSPAL